MSKTASQEIADRKAKYSALQHHTDNDGRVIGVSRLKPSEQLKLQEWSPGLSGSTTVLDENKDSETFGKTFEVPQRMPLQLAASVREIDGSYIAFPKSRAELDAILDRLEDTGLEAAGIALGKFAPKKADGDEGTEEKAEERAKN